MERDRIAEMVEEIVRNIDYDIWKELYVYEVGEEREEYINSLISLAEGYINDVS